jgi:Tol biopolymer transport system component
MTSIILLSSLIWAQARPVTPAYKGHCQAPVWSRDGARLAFEVNDHNLRKVELYVYAPGGGDPKPVRPPLPSGGDRAAAFGATSTQQVANEIAWAPAHINRFVYSASTTAGDYELFIEGAAAAVAASPGADPDPHWSPDGLSITFTSARSGQGDLYLVDLRNIAQAPRRLTTSATSAELDARFSPDSQRIAYVGHTSTGDKVMVLDNLAAPTPRNLVTGSGSQTRPSWSPEGGRIAFYDHTDDGGRVDLAVVPAIGGAKKVLVQGVVPNSKGPTWTPDGKGIVYVKDDDQNFDPLYWISGDGGSPRPIETGTVGNTDTDIVKGTDGKIWLALAAQGRDQDPTRDFRRIYVMPLSGL